MQRWEPGQLERALEALADRHEQHDRFVFEAAGDERKHVCGRTVEPLSILGDNEHRGSPRGFGKQIQRGERRQEGVRSGHLRHPERRQQRVALGDRELVDFVEDGLQQLMQPGECQQRLGLHACGLSTLIWSRWRVLWPMRAAPTFRSRARR